METKQTAVDWLEEKINLYNFEFGMASMRKYIEYAKQMEKEQIEESFNNSYYFIDGKQYYDETYGK
jgi:hypothetical protein